MGVFRLFRQRWATAGAATVIAMFVMVAQAQADASITCQNGSYTVTSTTTLALDGQSTGDCTVSGSIPQGATIDLTAEQFEVQSGTANDGTINYVSDNTAVYTPSGGTYTNAGTIEDTADSNTQELYAGTLTNTGTIDDAGAGSLLKFYAGNSSTAAGTLVNASGGQLVSGAGAEFSVYGGSTLVSQPGSSVTTANSGPDTQPNSGRLMVQGATAQVNGGTITGLLTIDNSSIDFASSVPGSGVVDLYDSDNLTGSIPANWTVNDHAGVTVTPGADNNGTLNMVNGSNLQDTANFTNTGTLNVTVSNSAVTTPTLINQGTISVAAGVYLAQNGALDLTSSSTLISNITAASSFGRLTVTGPLTLGGELDPALSGFTPSQGQEIPIFQIGNPVTGSFSSITGDWGIDLSHESADYVGIVYGAGATSGGTGSGQSTSPSTSNPKVGAAKVLEGRIDLSLSCAAGASCAITATGDVTEHLHGHRIVAVTAKARKAKKPVTKTVLVARGSASLAAGASGTLRLSLNSAGAKLLKQFYTLRVRVTVTSAGKTIKTVTVTLHQAVKKRKK